MKLKINPKYKLSEETIQFKKWIEREITKHDLRYENMDLLCNAILLFEACQRATESIMNDGAVLDTMKGKSTNPEVDVLTKNLKNVVMILNEYGMTLKSRTKLKGKETQEEESPMDYIVKMNGKK